MQWQQKKVADREVVTCCYCRAEYGVVSSAEQSSYVNLAAEAGLSVERDTSSYYTHHSFYGSGKKKHRGYGRW